jgi:predicted glycosyltransferase involved in capsule biosynthesis
MYFPQDLLFNCDKYDELRKTLLVYGTEARLQMKKYHFWHGT